MRHLSLNDLGRGRPWTPTSNPGLRVLEAASLVWNAAEQLYLVGLLVYAYSVGGTGTVALVGIIQTLPSAALLPALIRLTAGLHSDLLLRLLLIARLISVSTAAVLLAAGGEPIGVFALAAIDALAASLIRPLRSAMIPRIARSPEELVAANVAVSTGRSLAALLGPIVAALLLATRDVASTFALAAGLLGLALALSFEVRVAAFLPRIRMGDEGRRGGLHVLRVDPHPRAIVAVLVAQQIVRGMLPVLVVALAIDLLGAGDQAVGLLGSATGLGGLVGGAVAMGVIGRASLAAAFAGSVALWGAALAIPAIAPMLLPAMAALTVGGIAKSVLEVSGITLLQRTIAIDERAGVFGVLESAVTVAVASGALLGAILVAALGPAGALVVAAAVPVAAVTAAWPVLRSATRAAATSDEDIRLLRAVPMLRPLALCTTEELAAGVRRITFSPGETIIRQGDVGDRFYILESGELETLIDDVHVRLLHPGDSFGEIGLLRDVPRTATIRAVRQSVVVAMDREHFLAAVTGRPDAAAAAEEVIRGRLGA